MTMPHLMNCQHSGDGWCLDCVKELHDEKERLQEAMRMARCYARNPNAKHPIGLRAFSDACSVSPVQMSQWTSTMLNRLPDVV